MFILYYSIIIVKSFLQLSFYCFIINWHNLMTSYHDKVDHINSHPLLGGNRHSSDCFFPVLGFAARAGLSSGQKYCSKLYTAF